MRKLVVSEFVTLDGVMLETNAVGFVTHYPGLWQLEGTADGS